MLLSLKKTEKIQNKEKKLALLFTTTKQTRAETAYGSLCLKTTVEHAIMQFLNDQQVGPTSLATVSF